VVDVAGMIRIELFDRIRDGLLKQEQMRKRAVLNGRAGFDAWVEKARPHWDKLIAEYDAECERHYGLVLCEWLDWLDRKGLAFRGEIRWQIPTQGPLTFTPPSTDGLMKVIGKILGELGLVESTRRLGLFSAAPSQKTRGARGQGTVRKSVPQK
jgi:hypothetical protein